MSKALKVTATVQPRLVGDDMWGKTFVYTPSQMESAAEELKGRMVCLQHYTPNVDDPVEDQKEWILGHVDDAFVSYEILDMVSGEVRTSDSAQRLMVTILLHGENTASAKVISAIEDGTLRGVSLGAIHSMQRTEHGPKIVDTKPIEVSIVKKGDIPYSDIIHYTWANDAGDTITLEDIQLLPFPVGTTPVSTAASADGIFGGDYYLSMPVEKVLTEAGDQMPDNDTTPPKADPPASTDTTDLAAQLQILKQQVADQQKKMAEAEALRVKAEEEKAALEAQASLWEKHGTAITVAADNARKLCAGNPDASLKTMLDELDGVVSDHSLLVDPDCLQATLRSIGMVNLVHTTAAAAQKADNSMSAREAALQKEIEDTQKRLSAKAALEKDIEDTKKRLGAKAARNEGGNAPQAWRDRIKAKATGASGPTDGEPVSKKRGASEMENVETVAQNIQVAGPYNAFLGHAMEQGAHDLRDPSLSAPDVDIVTLAADPSLLAALDSVTPEDIADFFVDMRYKGTGEKPDLGVKRMRVSKDYAKRMRSQTLSVATIASDYEEPDFTW